MNDMILVTINFEPSADGHQQPDQRDISVKSTEIYGNAVRAVFDYGDSVYIIARPDAEVSILFDKLIVRVKG